MELSIGEREVIILGPGLAFISGARKILMLYGRAHQLSSRPGIIGKDLGS